MMLARPKEIEENFAVGFFKRTPRWILMLVLLLVAARIALPFGLKMYINSTLDSIPGYYGVIDDIDVSLWRGAYQIEGLRFVKMNGNAKEPLFSADRIDISIDWAAILNRRLVSKITLFEPHLQFIVRPSKSASQTSVDGSWQDKAKGLVPFEINRFMIFDGLVRYKDETKTPKIDVDLHELWLEAENITNASAKPDRLPSILVASARVMKSGELKLSSHMDLLSVPA